MRYEVDNYGMPVTYLFESFDIIDSVLIAYHGNEEHVIIPDNVTEIGEGAFDDCDKLVSVFIPNTVTYIGDYAFYNCINLKQVIIPDSVTEIGAGAFANCESLNSVSIPDSVAEIGEDAFEGCLLFYHK